VVESSTANRIILGKTDLVGVPFWDYSYPRTAILRSNLVQTECVNQRVKANPIVSKTILSKRGG